MIARWLVAVLACAACGDNLHRDDLFTAVSGSRLALQKYRYDDGTEQAVANEFYDTQIHTRCTPRATQRPVKIEPAARFPTGYLRCRGTTRPAHRYPC